MSTSTKRWFGVVALCALLVSSFVCGAASAKTYRIGMVHWIPWAPLNVAAEKGFWKDEGVDVEVVNYEGSSEIVAAVEHKRLDLVMDMIGCTVDLYNEGTDVQFVAETDWSHGGDKIIAKKGVKLAEVGDAPIGVYLNNPAVTFFLNKYLAEQDKKLSDFNLVEMDTEPLSDNFIAGRFKVIVSYDPQAIRAEQEGDGEVAATSADYAGCIPEGIWGRKDMVSQIPAEDLAKILKGWIKAVEWSQDPANWEEFATIMNNKTFDGEDTYSDEDLKDMLASVRIHDVATLKERNADGGGLEKFLEEMQSFLKENDMLKREYKVDDIFDNTVIMSVLQQ